MFLFLFSSQITFARVTENPNDYGYDPASFGSNAPTYYLYAPKTTAVLTKDTRDLQAQIDLLNQKNIELEAKLKQQPVVQPVPAQITTPQASPNDASQTQRIDTLEKKVGVVETAVNGLRSAIDKTINLLTKLLSLL